MDIRQRAFKIIESVEARVVGISDNRVQLNKSQCQFLASKLLDIQPYLRGNEKYLKSSRHAAHLHLLNTVTQAENLIRRCCCEHSITWPEVAFGAAEIKDDIVEVLLDVCWWQSLSHIAIATQVKSLPEDGALELLKTAEEDYVRLSKSLHSKHSELQVAAKSDKSELLSTLVQLVKEVATRAGKEQDSTHKSTLAVQLCSRFNLKVEDIQPSLNINQEAMMESRLNDYQDPKTIGQGSFGVVLKVRYFGRPCALKVFKGIYKEEATLLRGLQHPHIVQFYRYWEAPYTSEEAHSINRSHLLMELMSANLTEHIAARPKMNRSQASSSTSSFTRSTQSISMPFPLPVAIDIMLQVARAMEYLHGKKIAHRDLKTDNVLVRPFSGILELCDFGYVDVKLADFGLAKGDCNSSTGHQQTPNRGTPVYGAPEVFGEDIKQPRKFPLKADVWSFSMVCSEVLNGVPPYHNVTLRVGLHKRIREEGLRPALPNDCPDYLKFCIESCWQLQPARRPNFTDVCRMLKHAKWLSLDVTPTFRSMPVFFSYTTHSGYTEVPKATSSRLYLCLVIPLSYLYFCKVLELLESLSKYLVFVFANGNMDITLLICRQMHHGVRNLPGILSPLFWRLGPGL